MDDQAPVVRDANPGDISAIMRVYSACMAADGQYLPFLSPDDEAGILDWFRLKPLAVCLVTELSDQVVGVAGLRSASPGPGDGDPEGQWLEACRLAVHPSH